MNRKIAFIAIGIILVALIIFLFRSCGGSADVRMELKDSVTVGEPLKFKDATQGAETWLWDFGDGSELYNTASGEHRYAKSGTYKVLLIVNGTDSATKTVLVKDIVVEFEEDKTELGIEGPAVARVGQPVKFKAKTDGAKAWYWRFGESGEVDSDKEEPTYTYSAPAKYKVVLNIDGTKNEAVHYITVKPKPAPAGGGVSDEYVRQKLQAIADGGFEKEYNPLVDKLCDNQSIPVKIKGNSGSYEKSLFGYCRELEARVGKVKILNVRLIKDSDNCVSQIQVTQKAE